VNPGSEFLYSSRIRLATYRRDVLGEAREAARGLERLATDMNLPTEGLAMVRLTLGECYLAAGDTARGRQVLTALGRDPEFRQAGGHAHYHLARLDLAEGPLRDGAGSLRRHRPRQPRRRPTPTMRSTWAWPWPRNWRIPAAVRRSCSGTRRGSMPS
jgi:hypothetical protein